MQYKCAICGKLHDELPDIGADKPDYWFSIPEAERDKRCKFTSDICEIDNEHFFVRGVLSIPVHGYAPGFGFGVWVSHKKENFQTYLDNFNTDKVGPFFGWLNTSISYYPETLQLKTTAHYQGNNQRPLIKLEPSEHPLFVAQREGITLDEAWKIVHSYMA